MIVTYLRSSSYNTYDFCCHQYFIEYVLGIDSLSNKKAEKGTIVHKTLEVLAHEKLACQNKHKTYTDDIIGTHKINALPIKEIHERSYKYYVKNSPYSWNNKDSEDCLEWTHKALSLNGGMFDPRKRNILVPEVHFDFEIQKKWAKFNFKTLDGPVEGCLSMKGTIDLVTKIDKDTIEVIDWKTGQRKNWADITKPGAKGEKKTYEELCNDPQLRIYHYALSHLFPEYPNIIITINYINDGGPYTISFNKDDMYITETMMRQRYEAIRQDTLPQQSKGWWCNKFCHYGKNNFTGSNKTICEDVHNELLQIGMPRTVQQHTMNHDPKPWDKYNAPGE